MHTSPGDTAAARAVSTTKPTERQLPIRRKVTYAFTDLSGNLLYCIISGYALYYFTDVYGLSVTAAGTILLVARFFDAIGAPVWGMIIDHTHSRWGQSRPWFLWMGVPFVILVWLLFTSPSFSDESARIWYAGVVYILADIAYMGMSTPITAVLPNLTTDSNERTVTNSFRMVGGNIGNFLAVTFILPVASWIGGSNTSRSGWSTAVGIYAAVALILLTIAFADMRELNTGRARSISIRESFKAARGNWPWILVVVGNIIFWVGLDIRATTLPYFFQYNIGHSTLTSVFNGVSIIQVLAMAAVPLIAKKLHKYGSTIFGFALAALGQLGLAISGGNVTLLMVSWCIACLGSGAACSLFFEMVGDTVDYGEWKNGLRASGFLTAVGSSFCIQIGAGVGGFIPSLVMNAGGYVADRTQTASALSAIHFSFTWLPLIIFLIGIIPMVLYRRFEMHEPVVREDLRMRAIEAEGSGA
ncbi:MAG: MFS transporter [Bifidobacterium sp.]|jgi:sugar (glycoside-pentoside-hexuronide) transporter